MGDELKNAIDVFLDHLLSEKSLATEMKEIRKLKKEFSEVIIRLMTEKNLTLVRVKSHKLGPTDIVLKRKIKKVSITPKLLQKTLDGLHGEVVDAKMVDDLMKKIQSTENQEEYSCLQIKKLKLTETDDNAIVE